MATKPIVNVAGDDRSISEPAAIELDEIIDGAVAAGFGKARFLDALEDALRSRREAAGLQTPRHAPSDAASPRTIIDVLGDAQTAAFEDGNERIIYLLGLALDEAKASRKAAQDGSRSGLEEGT